MWFNSTATLSAGFLASNISSSYIIPRALEKVSIHLFCQCGSNAWPWQFNKEKIFHINTAEWLSFVKLKITFEERKKSPNLLNLNWFSVAFVSQELTPSKRCQEYSSNSAQSWAVVCQELVRLLSDRLLINGAALSPLQPTHTHTLQKKHTPAHTPGIIPNLHTVLSEDIPTCESLQTPKATSTSQSMFLLHKRF